MATRFPKNHAPERNFKKLLFDDYGLSIEKTAKMLAIPL